MSDLDYLYRRRKWCYDQLSSDNTEIEQVSNNYDSIVQYISKLDNTCSNYNDTGRMKTNAVRRIDSLPNCRSAKVYTEGMNSEITVKVKAGIMLFLGTLRQRCELRKRRYRIRYEDLDTEIKSLNREITDLNAEIAREERRLEQLRQESEQAETASV